MWLQAACGYLHTRISSLGFELNFFLGGGGAVVVSRLLICFIVFFYNSLSTKRLF